MSSNSPTLDVVVITWNKYELSLDCLAHASASSVPINLTVVDNASEDDTPRRIREQFPTAGLIVNDRNIGYGPAANLGATAGTSEFVSILNSDANVEPDYFERVLDCFADEQVAMVAGLSMNPATSKLDAAGATTDRGLNWLPLLPGGEPAQVDADDPRIAAPCSDAVVFRRAAFDAIGGFDDEIFAYWEDVDITMRLRQAGWKVAVCKDAKVWHVGSAALGKRSVAQMHLAAWGRGYLAGRYRLGPLWLVTEFLVGLLDSARLRSFTPFSRRMAGWRHGRKLPRREIPDGIEFNSWRTSMAARFNASS